MKRKILSLFATLFAVITSLSIATACSNPQAPSGSGIEITGVSVEENQSIKQDGENHLWLLYST